MSFEIPVARRYLQAFDLKKLFIDQMGWDQPGQPTSVTVDGEQFRLTMVAQKRGLGVFVCSPRADGSLPDFRLRGKIDGQLRKSAAEHLIVFANADKSMHRWQWVRREPGKPIARREFEYARGQAGDNLLQRLQRAVFTLEEEEQLDITRVGPRIIGAFDVERVTKRFYDRFKTEHDGFMKFVKGIPDEHLLRWYVSVTLNRLMFVYFIQAKHFLDGDDRYLQKHLADSAQKGKDLYYSDFLCPLFFDGLAKPLAERPAKAVKLLGNVPYLNGGIFERHQIEERYGQKIAIPDKAFEGLFDFFDQYRWNLDERPLRDDREINPDVLGYIFEKYINQKQMGAYYSKEDITGYISQNTIIPHLFDAAQKECKAAFDAGGSVWKLLKADPDRYIYDAVKHGVSLRLPKEIAAGVDDISCRTGWNKAAPDEYALSTEIWREVVARRQRCEEVRGKLASGSVNSINDLVTLNLHIRQFAQDVIEASDGELLTAFWHALTKIKVLDPTVGSGAFLFAALNVLEPLYEASLERMRTLLEELDASTEKHSPKKYEQFRQALAQAAQHPDEHYFVFKSIIVNNLYGVDIMEEAVEICKLRLFLKLAAQVDADPNKPNLGIEPLPDVDFNIRVGNTLVGFATRDDVRRSVQMGSVAGVEAQKLFTMPEENAQLELIESRAGDVDRLYHLFRRQQTEYGGIVRSEDKRELEIRLGELDAELDILLARQYAIHNFKGEKYRIWLANHKPFHWFVEFFGIIQDGGSDVIIGNPPYVENAKVRSEYGVVGYKSEGCGNLYAMMVERSLRLLNNLGHIGKIVPMSLVATQRMSIIRDALLGDMELLYFSNFSGDSNPSVLFNGVKMRLTIVLARKKSDTTSVQHLFSTKFMKWKPEFRQFLFNAISYTEILDDLKWNGLMPKVQDKIDAAILRKLFSYRKPLERYVIPNSANSVYAHRIAALFVKCFDFVPYFRNERDGVKRSEDYKVFSFGDRPSALIANAIINSSLFFYYYLAYSDAYHCGREQILGFPCNLDEMHKGTVSELIRLNEQLMEDMKRHAIRRKIEYHGTGWIAYDEFYPRFSKPIVDKIDRALAQHYHLTDEELDFIINYDVKFRLGADLDDTEEEE